MSCVTDGVSYEPETSKCPCCGEAHADSEPTTNYYRCPCGQEWANSWCGSCNDRCKGCNREIEPWQSIPWADVLPADTFLEADKLLSDLMEWNYLMGQFESPVWDRVEQYLARRREQK